MIRSMPESMFTFCSFAPFLSGGCIAREPRFHVHSQSFQSPLTRAAVSLGNYLLTFCFLTFASAHLHIVRCEEAKATRSGTKPNEPAQRNLAFVFLSSRRMLSLPLLQASPQRIFVDGCSMFPSSTRPRARPALGGDVSVWGRPRPSKREKLHPDRDLERARNPSL